MEVRKNTTCFPQNAFSYNEHKYGLGRKYRWCSADSSGRARLSPFIKKVWVVGHIAKGKSPAMGTWHSHKDIQILNRSILKI